MATGTSPVDAAAGGEGDAAARDASAPNPGEPNPAANWLLHILQLRQLSATEFEGDNERPGEGASEQPKGGRLFGGQVVAQALRAASLTVAAEGAVGHSPRDAHSLHAYFLRGGDPGVPVRFAVETLTDGRSFSARRVTARQRDAVILTLDASFHAREDGLVHQEPMPEVPPPEALPDDYRVERLHERPGFANLSMRRRPFTLRSVYATHERARDEDFQWNPVWVRFDAVAPNDDALARCLLAYASDMGIVSTGAIPHRVSREALSMASLDHALWIHRPVPIDEWLLFAKRTVVAAHGRVLNRATFYRRDGEVVASCSQEGVMRLRRER